MPDPFSAMRSIMRFGPPMRAPSRLEPELAWIGTPFRVAPPPAVDRNNSSVTGANSAATTGRPSTTRAADTDQSSRPAMKARVPSIGSNTQTRRAATPPDPPAAHRIGALALLDPEARGAPAVIAGHHVGAGADQVGDVEPLVDILDQLFGAPLARFEMQI